MNNSNLKNKFNKWFKGLSKRSRFVVSCLTGVAAATAIAIPTFMCVSCNPDSGADEKALFTVTFLGADFDKDSSKLAIKKDSYVAFKIDSTKEVSKVNYVKIGGKEIQEGHYTLVHIDDTNKKIELKAIVMLSREIEISVTLKDKKEPEPGKKWYQDENYIKGLTVDDVGLLKDVVVNNQTHKVRLIGIDHDVDENGNTIHTTWEFYNLISDDQGEYLGYQWNDMNTGTKANWDYINSSIRFALTGEGNNSGKTGEKAEEILAARKGQETWDSNYKNKTVLSMLPTDLTSVIKTAKKTVGVKTDAGGEEYTQKEFVDKLFLISACEAGYSYDVTGGGEIYDFYDDYTITVDEARYKRQVSDNTYTKSTLILKGKGHSFENNVGNYAGYNWANEFLPVGGFYWYRSPSTGSDNVLTCSSLNAIQDKAGMAYALGVAPAFCI